MLLKDSYYKRSHYEKNVTYSNINTGCTFTTGVLAKQYQESSRSSWDMLLYVGLALIGGGLWMCLLSRGTYFFYESVANLELEHRKLEEKLEE